MAFRIQSQSAGKDEKDFIEGADRFQKHHPNLNWLTVSAGQLVDGSLHITVELQDGLHPVSVQPKPNMADAVSEALERFLKSNGK